MIEVNNTGRKTLIAPLKERGTRTGGVWQLGILLNPVVNYRPAYPAARGYEPSDGSYRVVLGC